MSSDGIEPNGRYGHVAFVHENRVIMYKHVFIIVCVTDSCIYKVGRTVRYCSMICGW